MGGGFPEWEGDTYCRMHKCIPVESCPALPSNSEGLASQPWVLFKYQRK